MDKQSLAKIGVVLLLAANVGGYYYFWPRHHHGRTTAAARSTANGENQEKGDAKIDPQPKPIKREPSATPPCRLSPNRAFRAFPRFQGNRMPTRSPSPTCSGKLAKRNPSCPPCPRRNRQMGT